MPNRVEKSETDGKYHAYGELGDHYIGDTLEDVALQALNAQQGAKKVYSEEKRKRTELEEQLAQSSNLNPQNQPQPTQAVDPNLGNYLWDTLGQTLPKPMKGDQLRQRLMDIDSKQAVVDQISDRMVSADFLQMAQDFPNTPQSVEALASKVDEMKWAYTAPNLLAAHTLLVRENSIDQTKGYKPLSIEEQNQQWDKALRESNRPTPPPMPQGQSPDTNRQEENPWAMDNAKLRALAIQQELAAKGK